MKNHINKFIFSFMVLLSLSGCFYLQPAFNSNSSFNPKNIIPLKLEPLTASEKGNPKTYVVYGKTYTVLKTSKGYKKTGFVSIYSDNFNFETTSSGEKYNMNKLSAASRVLPLPSYVNILNHQTGLSVNVLVNDRGPYSSNAILRISQSAAYKLGIKKQDDISNHKVTVTAIKPYTIITWQKNFYLQLAIFSSKKKADQVNSYLKSVFSFNNSTVVPLITQEESVYAIRIGPFRTKEIANKYLQTNLNSLPMIPSIVEN